MQVLVINSQDLKDDEPGVVDRVLTFTNMSEGLDLKKKYRYNGQLRPEIDLQWPPGAVVSTVPRDCTSRCWRCEVARTGKPQGGDRVSSRARPSWAVVM